MLDKQKALWYNKYIRNNKKNKKKERGNEHGKQQNHKERVFRNRKGYR